MKPTYEELENKIEALEKQDLECRLTEEEIIKKKNEWVRTFDAVSDLIAILDDRYRIVRVNKAMADRIGMNPDEAVGLTCYEHVHGTKAPPSFCPHSKLLETGKRGVAEFHEERLGGDFLVSVSPLHDTEGRLIGSVHIAHDITKRKQTEEALRKSEENYRNLVSLSPDPMVIIQEGNNQLLSSSFTELFGYNQADVDDGLGILELIPEDYKEAVRKRLEDRLSGKTVQKSMRVDIMAKDGKRISCESSGILIQYSGRPAILLTIHDITERIKAQEALEKAYDDLQREMEERKRLEKTLMQEEKLKTLGTIAAEVAHEIRNPVVSIGGFAQRLKQKAPDLAECDIILSESQRLEKILSRIGNYLEPVELHPKECSVNTIITDCLNLLSSETESRQVKCLLDLAPGLSTAYVDSEILGQIFINLIHNATEAMDKGEELLIKSFESDHEINIEFKNQAQGLRVKYPEALCMPFAEGGQSFGLPLCYRLLKDLGGFLSFTQDNDFIVFTVSLPKTVKPIPLT